MALVAKGELATGGYENLQLDADGLLRVTTTPDLTDELVLAAASGSTDGMGKIGTLAATTGVMYVCADCSAKNYSKAYWRVQGDNAHSISLYRSRTRIDSKTLTCSSLGDAETLIVNGLTYTAEATAADALFASRKFYTGGDDTADAAALAALINADYTVTLASTSVGDTVTINNGISSYVYTAKATAAVASRQFSQAGTDTQDAASLALCVNDRQDVTCATAAAGDTVVITKDGTAYTFTGHATTTTAANREWDIADDNTAAAAIATCVNDATYGVPGVTASASSAVVSFAPDTSSDMGFTVTTSNATRLATSAAYGVPGVTAAVTSTTGEVYFTPNAGWKEAITVTSSNGTRLAVVDIDTPGIVATSALGVVTIAPASRNETASVIYAVTGTAGAHLAVADTTLANLLLDEGSTRTGIAANSTTAGTLYEQYADGWPYLYCAVTNTDGDAGTYVVGATLVA